MQQSKIIKTISYDQEEIIKWIINLYCPNGIELDPTYSKGIFYKNIPGPSLQYDLIPQTKETIKADCKNLPLADNSINSIMFDPPFTAGYGKNAPGGIIRKRFDMFRYMNDCWKMYHKSLTEFYRILKNKGVLIFKCQDTISSGKQYLSHIEIINYAIRLGFYPKDIFILLAKNRIIGHNHNIQKHARKFHSYFLVLIKQNNPVIYGEV